MEIAGHGRAELCERTLEVVEPIRARGRLSSFLLQLTPAFKPGDHRLEELGRAAGAAFACVDAPLVKAPHVLPPVDAVTRSDLGYLRAHGRNAEGYLRGRSAAERFAWRYSDEELHEIATRAQLLANEAADVRLIFGNGAHAIEAAERMRMWLRQ